MAFRFTLPKIYVVHLGNNQQLMQVAKDDIARISMRLHVRRMFGIHDNDVVFAMINSMSSTIACYLYRISTHYILSNIEQVTSLAYQCEKFLSGLIFQTLLLLSINDTKRSNICSNIFGDSKQALELICRMICA